MALRRSAPAPAAERASLPPMIQYDEVIAKQRESDRRDFRKYLVNSGTIKSLVKLHTHVYKKEMRLPNAQLLKEFFADHQGDSPADVESQALAATNAELHAQHEVLAQQSESLETRLRLAVASRLWKGLTAPEFWEPRGIDPASFATDGLTGEQIYERLCGNTVDEAAGGKVLVNLLRPASICSDAMPRRLHCGSFGGWVRYEASQEIIDWCRTDLIPRFVDSSVDAPFEFDVTADLRASDLYPQKITEAAKTLSLSPDGLAELFKAMAWRFGGDMEKTPTLCKFRLAEPSETEDCCNQPPDSADAIELLAGEVFVVEVIGFDGPRQAGVLLNEVKILVHPAQIGELEELLVAAAAEGKTVIGEIHPTFL